MQHNEEENKCCKECWAYPWHCLNKNCKCHNHEGSGISKQTKMAEENWIAAEDVIETIWNHSVSKEECQEIMVKLLKQTISSAYTRGKEDAMFDISLSKGGIGNFGEKGEVTLTNTKHE